MTHNLDPHDKQEPHTHKVENDTNKLCEQDPTQLNQGQRTPALLRSAADEKPQARGPLCGRLC